jgi:hypothetical protein
MNEVITAVFGNGSAATAAVHDLEVAKIPSVEIIPDRQRNADAGNRGPSPQCALVTVAVDEPHADLVSGILNMYAPVAVQKRAA